MRRNAGVGAEANFNVHRVRASLFIYADRVDIVADYLIRITPGLALIAAVFLILPSKQVLARIFVLIGGFVLMRDAMTPEGLWAFGVTPPAVWLRFIDSSTVLLILGLLSGITAAVLLRLPHLGSLVRWGKLRSWKPYVFGVVAGCLVATPFLLVSMGTPISERGGGVAVSLLPALLFMALVGNFLEEVIFRGFLQSHLDKSMSKTRSALLSGLTFAAAHTFLAATVTDIGWPLLIFVTVEGLACAFIYRYHGLIASTLTHGTAIFLLASGLL